MENQDISAIHLDGIERYITSYRQMLLREPGNYEMNVGPLTPFQYQSILFNNLGYDKCPRDSLWMERGLNVEDVNKTEVLDYPITFNTLRITQNCTLFELMMVIRNWVKGGLERGHLLDPCRSFQLPSRQEIQYNMQNRVRIQRSAVVKSKMDTWDKADIMWRRMYNLVPSLDKEYFEYCLVNFEGYSKQIKTYDPYAAFVSAIIDPDLLFSAIEQSEKEASHVIYNNSDKSIPLVLMDDRPIAEEFAKILNAKLGHLSRIYRGRGAGGFLRDKNSKRLVSVGVPTVGNPIQLHSPIAFGQNGITQAEQILIGTIYEQIAATPLDGEHKGVVMSYVEPSSLEFIDRMGEDSITRIATYKRLYYTIEQLRAAVPELINPKDKLIMSEPFFIDPDRFGLYSRSRNKFYIVGLDLVVREMHPYEALDYYSIYLGKDVLLDPQELGEGIEAAPVDDIDLGALEMESLGLKGQPFMVPIPIAPVASNPNVYQPQAIPITVNQNRELYGMNPNLVEV